MQYWLFKSEPSCFGIDDLSAAVKRTTHWDGVRNYQVRNFLQNAIQPKDLAFFYHSNAKPSGVVGVMEIISPGYPDHTAWDPHSDHYDPKSTEQEPRWYMVDVKFKEKFPRMVDLAEIKQHPILQRMSVAQTGSRLSITPVTAKEWTIITDLAHQ